MYDFNYKVCRKNTYSDKWDNVKDLSRYEPIPLWVADMDFEVAPSIISSLENRISHHVFGYTYLTDEYYDSIIYWMKRRHNWNIKKEWIKFSLGIMSGINCIINCFTNYGDEVIVQSPVYHSFFKVIEDNGCRVVENKLKFDGNKYIMDFEDLEKLINEKTKILLLCSPHNPIGRVWTKQELKILGEICLKHNILIISDEVHSDIIYKGYKHTVFSMVDKRFKEISIICSSPNKTFNIAGFQAGNTIIESNNLREKLEKHWDKFHMSEPNTFTFIAQEAAYIKSEDWYYELMDYLEENKNFVIEFIDKNIPKLRVIKPQGTYLLWLDCSKLNMSSEKLDEFFNKDCGVILNSGKSFRGNGEKFQRINIATQRSILEEALKRIESEINKL